MAGLIGWQGLQLWTLGRQGTINLPFTGSIAKVSGTYLSPEAGFALGAFVVGLSVASVVRESRRRVGRGLPTPSLAAALVRPIVVGVALLAVIAVLDTNRGVPVPLVILGVLVAGVDWVLMRTRFGRHVYATGGGIDAARRAGINVIRVRTLVFMASSMLAAAGGVLAVSRLAAVNQSTGGSDTLLNAIAAAVIGGTSLFGGRGRASSAILGSLVIVSIANGMFLLSLDSSVRFMITAAVLLTSVIIDSFTRRGQVVRR